ncbi:MAG: hypothetical protein AAGF11_55270 [Myxococcota bacterium]
MQRISPLLLTLGLGLAACGDDLPDDHTSSNGNQEGPNSTTEGPPGTTASSTSGVIPPVTSSSSTTTASTPSSTSDNGNTFGEVDECQLTSDCDAGLYCVAPFIESLGPEGKGLNECVAACVDLMDETRWCLDAAACCDPAAECTDRGYCELPGDSADTDGTGSMGNSSGTGDTSTGTTGGR